jgi:hypothetical protein
MPDETRDRGRSPRGAAWDGMRWIRSLVDVEGKQYTDTPTEAGTQMFRERMLRERHRPGCSCNLHQRLLRVYGEVDHGTHSKWGATDTSLMGIRTSSKVPA